jgi:hypothetical protein
MQAWPFRVLQGRSLLDDVCQKLAEWINRQELENPRPCGKFFPWARSSNG